MPSKTNSTTTYVGLLRGINVGGHNRVPMADLRLLGGELGWRDVQTYIQSGNLVFAANEPATIVERQLESAIERRFQLQIPVVVRTATAWADCAADNPFPDEVRSDPNHVLLALSKRPPRAGAEGDLQARAADGERVVQAGDGLWIYFPAGIGKSKLTPALLERLVGSPVTARNWLTVRKLCELARAHRP
ncbi:MAG TPA: DUF1697 domain-containing protein [Verrucomicrobiae bacterium]|nr:DUF1697 domain-containing protein [Verrucomicrobiae bacterium]